MIAFDDFIGMSTKMMTTCCCHHQHHLAKPSKRTMTAKTSMPMDIGNNDNGRHDAATSDATTSGATTSDANEDFGEGGQCFLCCFLMHAAGCQMDPMWLHEMTEVRLLL
jgi:hypothetical protein